MTDYKEAGVNIERGDEFVERIKPLARSTQRLGANSDLGGFGGLFDLAACKFKDPILVAASDGVGTKLKLATALNKHNTIGIDLVAMCVNDLVVQGAEPLFFLDYFATSRLHLALAQDVITGIADGCRQAGAALIGGETAEMPGIYSGEDYDLAGFAVGAVERTAILPRTETIKEGDVIIGLASSGLHSNGFSLVRKIIEKYKLDLGEKLYENKTLGEILLTPTKIYVKELFALIRKFGDDIKAIAHITGGGLIGNIPRVLPPQLVAEIDYRSWQRPEIFNFLITKGEVPESDARHTFNLGIGMVIVVDEKKAAAIIAEYNQSEAWIIGRLHKKL